MTEKPIAGSHDNLTADTLHDKERISSERFFLSRVVGIEAIVSILGNKSVLNSNSGKYEGKTHFRFGRDWITENYNTVSGYGRGGNTVGVFIIFPRESIKLEVPAPSSGSITGQEVVVPPETIITYQDYLWVL